MLPVICYLRASHGSSLSDRAIVLFLWYCTAITVLCFNSLKVSLCSCRSASV